MAKRLRVHIYSENSHKSETMELPIWKITLWLFIVSSAVIGLFFIDPFEISEALFSEKRQAIKSENKILAQTVKSTKDRTIIADDDLKNAKLVKDEVSRLANMPGNPEQSVIVTASADLDLNLQRIRRAHKNFKLLLDSLTQNTSMAESLPILHPVKNHNYVSARFGMIKDPFTNQILPHRGIDYATPKGEGVLATGKGIVSSTEKMKGFGNTITIEHSNNIKSFYAHLETINVSVGEQVQRGDKIATVGKTGRSSGPHVHYEINFMNQPINPELFFITP